MMIVRSALDHLVGFIHRLRIRRAYIIAVAGLLGAYLLFGWLALPAIVQSQMERYILQRSGHHLTMDRPSFNPVLLSFRINNLRLTEPDGKLLASFNNLIVDFSLASLFRRAYVFDEISLDGLHVSVAALPKDRLNWSALIESLRSKEQTNTELPRLIVRKFSLSHGRLDLADRRSALARAASLAPLDIELTDLSTLPNEKGNYELAARTSFGARIRWEGQIALKPVSIVGRFAVDEVALAKLAAFAPPPPNLAAPEGRAALSAHYQAGMIAGRFNVRLDRLAVRIDGLRIRGRADPNATLTFGRVDLTGGRFDLRDRLITIDAIAARGGGINAERAAGGRIKLLDLLPATINATGNEQAAKPDPAIAGWHYRIAHLTVQGLSARFRDQTVDPAAEFSLQDVAAEVGGVSGDKKTPLPVHLAFRSRDGGTFDAQGTFVPADASADLQIRLDSLALTPAQPYVGHLTTLKLTSGTLSSEGHVVYDGTKVLFTGSMAVRDLRILEADGRQVFLAWKSLTTTTLTAGTTKVAVRELLLDGLNTRFIIAKDKSVNFTQVLRRSPAASSPQGAQTGLSTPIPVSIERLRIRGSQLEYADNSLVLPFGTHIHALQGTIVNMSSTGTPAHLQLEGQIDDYGMARAYGQLNMFRPTDFLDIKVDFTNVEMTRLTPYSATFAGRRINSGKLTLDLEYKINNRQLAGDNHIVMDQLTLGEHVKSPEASDWPLDLAIAILEDSNGQIDLGLPVSGSLDDPKFSYGQIIWKAIGSILTKIVTSPFRALGALFGRDDKFDGLVFEAGRSKLTPPEREKLTRFAASLNQRPNLSVVVHGTWSDADRPALQDLQLRQALAGKLGLSAAGDPGPITPDQPNVKPALEDLYADRFGSGALSALKDGFRKANPGQLPESATTKVVSALTGIFDAKPALTDKDTAELKGTDFHAMLYQKLRDAEEVSDAKLQALAQARAEDVMTGLREARAPLDRITLQAAERVDASEKNIPLKMDMAAAAAKPAAASLVKS
jgi:hypothetical protein